MSRVLLQKNRDVYGAREVLPNLQRQRCVVLCV
jgi:hypothetical protein